MNRIDFIKTLGLASTGLILPKNLLGKSLFMITIFEECNIIIIQKLKNLLKKEIYCTLSTRKETYTMHLLLKFIIKSINWDICLLMRT